MQRYDECDYHNAIDEDDDGQDYDEDQLFLRAGDSFTLSR